VPVEERLRAVPVANINLLVEYGTQFDRGDDGCAVAELGNTKEGTSIPVDFQKALGESRGRCYKGITAACWSGRKYRFLPGKEGTDMLIQGRTMCKSTEA
jgi:hypothetical protein